MLPHGSPRARRVSPLLSSPPVTMLPNGQKAPLLYRPVTTRCLCLAGTRKGKARHVTVRCPRPSVASMLATSHHLLQVLAGPSVVVCPAGELAHQRRRGHLGSQRRGGHAIAERFQRVIHPLHRAGE